MKITGITAQVKTRGRYSVFVDERFAFGLSELGLIDSGIHIGLEISESELADFKATAAVDKIYNMALGLIARRARSEYELRQYLRRKEVDEQAMVAILNKLSDRGYINDENFATAWVESRRLMKSMSKRKLQMELSQKGIDRQIVERVLAKDEVRDDDVLKKLIVKKRSQTRYQDDKKLMQYLAGQGFGYDDIKRAISSDELED